MRRASVEAPSPKSNSSSKRTNGDIRAYSSLTPGRDNCCSYRSTVSIYPSPVAHIDSVMYLDLTCCFPIDPVVSRGCTDVVGQTPVEFTSARPITTMHLLSVGLPPSLTTPSSQTASRNEISETTHSGCPADLTSCTLCHVADSLKPEAVPNKPTHAAGTWKRTRRVTDGHMDGFATSRANTGAAMPPSHGSPVSILCTDPILGVDPSEMPGLVSCSGQSAHAMLNRPIRLSTEHSKWQVVCPRALDRSNAQPRQTGGHFIGLVGECARFLAALVR